MCKDAAFQIFTKRLADIGLGGVVVALAVELTCTGQLKPGLEVLGDGLVQKSPLGVARVVELGFSGCCGRGCRSRAAARMVVRMLPCV
jgi:hypothetical protein